MHILETLIDKGVVNPKNVFYARLDYDLNRGIPKDANDSAHYPLQIHSYGCDLYISGISAGFNGDGPRTVIAILKKMGLIITAEDERAITQESYDEHGVRITKIVRTIHDR